MNILSSFWKTQTTTVSENIIKNTVTQLPKVHDSITPAIVGASALKSAQIIKKILTKR
jgi:hypothetical protein